MGTNAVGAMIVAGADGFMKTHYRTFNIKDRDLTPGDDYGMMREVLRRRFARLMKDAAAAGAGDGRTGRRVTRPPFRRGRTLSLSMAAKDNSMRREAY